MIGIFLARFIPIIGVLLYLFSCWFKYKISEDEMEKFKSKKEFWGYIFNPFGAFVRASDKIDEFFKDK